MSDLKLISAQNITSSTSSIVFDNLPQTYRHLVIVANITGASSTQLRTQIRLNNDTSSAYRTFRVTGTGTGRVESFHTGTAGWLAYGATVNNGQRLAIDSIIFDYRSVTKGKSAMSRASNGQIATETLNAYYNVTSTAVTRVDIIAELANFGANSSFAIFGLVG